MNAALTIMRERGGDRKREREKQRETDRARERERETDRQRDRDRQTHRQRQRETEAALHVYIMVTIGSTTMIHLGVCFMLWAMKHTLLSTQKK